MGCVGAIAVNWATCEYGSVSKARQARARRKILERRRRNAERRRAKLAAKMLIEDHPANGTREFRAYSKEGKLAAVSPDGVEWTSRLITEGTISGLVFGPVLRYEQC